VQTILNSFASVGYITIILVLCYYIFAIAGNILFGENDPWHFGNAHLSMMSLFRVSTGEMMRLEMMRIHLHTVLTHYTHALYAYTILIHCAHTHYR
jgi:hypothetical protein